MQIGVLFRNKGNWPAMTAVIMAKREFARAQHCQGYNPTEAQFNPAEKPKEETIDGLQVKTNPEVPVHCVRVCTEEE